MDLLANFSLAAIVWATLLAGRPFALQYARKGIPPERWNDPKLIEGCRFITLVAGGIIFTTLFKRRKRLQREQQEQ